MHSMYKKLIANTLNSSSLKYKYVHMLSTYSWQFTTLWSPKNMKMGSISIFTNFIPRKNIYKFVDQISHKKPYLSYSINSGTIMVSLLDDKERHYNYDKKCWPYLVYNNSNKTMVLNQFKKMYHD